MFSTNKSIIKNLFILSVLFVCSNNTNAQMQYMNCDFWQSKVNTAIKIQSSEKQNTTDLKSLLKNNDKSNLGKPFNNLDHRVIFFGIECLLKSEKNKNDSNLSGVTRPNVSQTFGSTTVEVAALYYVSYVFLQKWDHANAPFLVNQIDNKLNSDKDVSKAYKAYKKWFKKIKDVGLNEARKQKLDPLNGLNVSWY